MAVPGGFEPPILRLCMHALIRQRGSGLDLERSPSACRIPGLCPIELRGHVALPG